MKIPQISIQNRFQSLATWISPLAFLTLLTLMFPSMPWAATDLPGSGVGHSAGAGSPFTSYDAGIVVYCFLTAGLVFLLLGGAFLIVNIGLMSRRPEDRTGTRNPSDLGFLKSQVWPKVPVKKATLPAEEEDFTETEQDLGHTDDTPPSEITSKVTSKTNAA